ncbi:MAG TPA: hypothetical protein VIV60_10155 [Polyangiaceae bacterium]
MNDRLIWLLLTGVLGCGSPTKVRSPKDERPMPASPSSPPTTKVRPTIESQRAPFIEGCMKNIPVAEYCECGFVQFSTLFKDADLSKEIAPADPRMQELSNRTRSECSNKVPEATVKEHTMQSCVAGDVKKEPYCDCAWNVLRSKLSVGEIWAFQAPASPQWSEAKLRIPKSCKGKYPRDLAASEFLEACKKDGEKSEKQCLCVWKKVSKRFSIEEIVAGTADPSQLKDLDKCK